MAKTLRERFVRLVSLGLSSTAYTAIIFAYTSCSIQKPDKRPANESRIDPLLQTKHRSLYFSPEQWREIHGTDRNKNGLRDDLDAILASTELRGQSLISSQLYLRSMHDVLRVLERNYAAGVEADGVGSAAREPLAEAFSKVAVNWQCCKVLAESDQILAKSLPLLEFHFRNTTARNIAFEFATIEAGALQTILESPQVLSQICENAAHGLRPKASNNLEKSSL